MPFRINLTSASVGLCLAAATSLVACGGSAPSFEASTSNESSISGASSGTVDVPFEVDCVPTQPGQNVFVVGDIPELGSWDPNRAVPLVGMFGSWDAVGNKFFLFSWSTNVKLKTGATMQFKFIIIDQNGNVTWESGPNRTQTVGGPIQAATTLSVSTNNTIYTYADYWNRANGFQCSSTYWDYSNWLGQQRA